MNLAEQHYQLAGISYEEVKLLMQEGTVLSSPDFCGGLFKNAWSENPGLVPVVAVAVLRTRDDAIYKEGVRLAELHNVPLVVFSGD